MMFRYLLCLFVFYLPGLPVFAQQDSANSSITAIHDQGRAVYNFYCYQCHGYAGDAKTLASSFLNPQPRNFAATDPAHLSREQMITTLREGRDGTAMVSFSSVLQDGEITAVIDYIRAEFMSGEKSRLVYHSPENGWVNHERYAAAFPFAKGDIPLDRKWEQLTAEQQQGKRLYMTACISCHDRGNLQADGAIWDLRPLSYPRKHYSHTQPLDSISGASPYAIHDQPPAANDLSGIAQQGEVLFQINCAFCHAADGTARNWIGRFLEPHPRDLTTTQILQREMKALRQVVLEGLQGTSMPAWKHVLSEAEIDAIFAYLRHVYANRPAPLDAPQPTQTPAQPTGLTWRKQS
jgi:cytochrome c oxidase cbb3-type subunit 3